MVAINLYRDGRIVETISLVDSFADARRLMRDCPYLARNRNGEIRFRYVKLPKIKAIKTEQRHGYDFSHEERY